MLAFKKQGVNRRALCQIANTASSGNAKTNIGLTSSITEYSLSVTGIRIDIMTLRIIAKLDVKPPFVVKPVHFEGLRKVGEPAVLAYKYYQQGADELIYVDIVSSLYQRKLLTPYIEETAEKSLVPLGVGGG